MRNATCWLWHSSTGCQLLTSKVKDATAIRDFFNITHINPSVIERTWNLEITVICLSHAAKVRAGSLENYILLTPKYIKKEEIAQSLNFSWKHPGVYLHISFLYLCLLWTCNRWECMHDVYLKNNNILIMHQKHTQK